MSNWDQMDELSLVTIIQFDSLSTYSKIEVSL